ncbi:MAG: hypothetical protein ACYSYV_12480, partial [Planctomycetota bacterium]
AGKKKKGTVVVLNRSTKARRVRIVWPGVKFTKMEVVDPYYENDVRKAPRASKKGTTEVTVAPGAIVTLSNAALNKVRKDVLRR